jgi:hypothetical protein
MLFLKTRCIIITDSLVFSPFGKNMRMSEVFVRLWYEIPVAISCNQCAGCMLASVHHDMVYVLMYACMLGMCAHIHMHAICHVISMYANVEHVA